MCVWGKLSCTEKATAFPTLPHPVAQDHVHFVHFGKKVLRELSGLLWPHKLCGLCMYALGQFLLVPGTVYLRMVAELKAPGKFGLW